MARAPRYDVPRAAPGRLRLVQEFVNTTDLEHAREWLATPDDLADWLAGRRLLEPGARVVPADLVRARALREALRARLAEHNGGDPDPGARDVFAATALRARLAVDWEAGIPALEPRATGVDGALGRVLVAAVSAGHDGSWARLKTCRRCRWAFYDASRNRSASWCSMQLCGNRSKTRAYRHRRAAATD